MPWRLERLIVLPLLLYRRLRFGYAFRKITLTQGKYAIVDPDDYLWLSKYKWSASRVCNKFYAVRTEKCKKTGKLKTIRMHREILKVPAGLECEVTMTSSAAIKTE